MRPKANIPADCAVLWPKSWEKYCDACFLGTKNWFSIWNSSLLVGPFSKNTRNHIYKNNVSSAYRSWMHGVYSEFLFHFCICKLSMLGHGLQEHSLQDVFSWSQLSSPAVSESTDWWTFQHHKISDLMLLMLLMLLFIPPMPTHSRESNEGTNTYTPIHVIGALLLRSRTKPIQLHAIIKVPDYLLMKKLGCKQWEARHCVVRLGEPPLIYIVEME